VSLNLLWISVLKRDHPGALLILLPNYKFVITYEQEVRLIQKHVSMTLIFALEEDKLGLAKIACTVIIFVHSYFNRVWLILRVRLIKYGTELSLPIYLDLLPSLCGLSVPKLLIDFHAQPSVLLVLVLILLLDLFLKFYQLLVFVILHIIF
jgi:hypothetical protein